MAYYGLFCYPRASQKVPIGPLDWDIHYLGVFWGISGEKMGSRPPELLQNCFFGAKLMKFAQIKPNNPPKKPK